MCIYSYVFICVGINFSYTTLNIAKKQDVVVINKYTRADYCDYK